MKTNTILRLLIAALLLTAGSATAWSKTNRQPKALINSAGSLIPQLLDGNQYRTIVYIVNLGATAEPFRLNLLNEDGTPASFHFAELGGSSGSLSGTVPAEGQSIFHTNGGAAVSGIQVGWGSFDILSTGSDVSVYVVLESADPLTGNWTTQSMVTADEIFISDSEQSLLLFDQTLGFVCGAAIVNTDAFDPAALIIDVLDANGVVLGSGNLTVPPNNHVQFVLNDSYPLTAGIAGSLRIRNATADQFSSLSIIGIKSTAYISGWTQTSLPVIQSVQ